MEGGTEDETLKARTEWEDVGNVIVLVNADVPCLVMEDSMPITFFIVVIIIEKFYYISKWAYFCLIWQIGLGIIQF